MSSKKNHYSLSASYFSKYLSGRRKRIVVIFLSVLILTIIFFLAISTPLYKASSVLTIKKVTAVKTDRNSADAFKKHYLAQLKSATVEAELVKRLGLTAVFYKKSLFKPTELFGKKLPLRLELTENKLTRNEVFKLRKFGISSYEFEHNGLSYKNLFGQTITLPNLKFSILKKSRSSFAANDLILKIATVKKTLDELHKAIKIKPDKADSSKINIQVRATSKEKAATILNALYQLSFNDYVDSGGSKQLDFIENQLKGLQLKLSSYKEDSTELRNSPNKVIAVPSLSSADAAELNKQLSIFKSLAPYIKTADSQFSLFPDNYGISDVILKSLILKMNAIQVQKQEALDSGKNKAEVANFNQKISGLNTAIKNRIASKAEEYRDVLDRKTEKVKGSESINADTKIKDLQKEHSANLEFYAYLLNKHSEMRTLNNSTNSIDNHLQKSPITYSEDISKYALYSILSVLAITLVVVLTIKRDNDDVLIKPAELKKFTSIPELPPVKFCSQVDLTEPSGSEDLLKWEHTGENNKTLVDELCMSKGTILVISSYTKNSGKTFISTNLAKAIASKGKKVILLDTCIQNFKARDLLGVEPDFGLTDYINNERIAALDIIKRTNLAGDVSFVSPGMLDMSTAQLFSHSRMTKLILYLKNSFDCIIIKSSSFADFTYLRNLKHLEMVWINILKEKEISGRQLRNFEKVEGLGHAEKKYVLINRSAK